MTSLKVLINRYNVINQILKCSSTFNYIGNRHQVTFKRINVIDPNYIQTRFKYDKPIKNKPRNNADEVSS